ncbi:MAG: tetratricopeptide repeat protein [Desulfobulbaceae bacterium]|nr:tetratricopeptide repeat protein [Desulfobulbaceae bacterium]
MKLLYHCILIFLSLLPCSAQASELVKISRIDTKDIIQLYFSFDVTPEFTSTRYNRRIDLEFMATTRPPLVSLGEPDSNIVKILPRPVKDRLIISLFFRYRPQQHKLTKSSDGKLVFEVLLGNEYSKSYQNLADSLNGLTVLDRLASDSTNPYQISPYTKDWMSFFSLYESPVQIDVPVKFNLPPFPIVDLLPPGGDENLRILSEEMFELANQDLWDPLAEKLLASIQVTTDIETKKLLALTYGEVLSRGDNFEDAFRQLYLLKEEFSDELLGTYANYLLIHLRAVHEDPYIAENDFRLLESSIRKTLSLAPYFLLSQIEIALAAQNYTRLNHLLLKDDIAFPKQIAEIVQIRQADYWYAINQPVKAKAAYQLQAESPVLQSLPYSLNGACNTYYAQKKYMDAVTCYTTLSTLVLDEKLLGLIDYRKNMAKRKVMEETSLIDAFSEIESTFPNTEASFRAALKRNDLLFLQNKNRGMQAIDNYGAIAKTAKSRAIREEALFKQALVHALLGESTVSIQLLQKFLREFLIGDVRISAQALLIELLPGEIKKLIDNQEYLKPLVLAKQNKDLFQNKWIDSTFLVDIAKAYNRIGIFDEAQKLYLYLISVMPVDQKEAFFPPMIQAAFNNGNFPLVEDYAAQYAYTYPNGRYTPQIFLFRLQALIADERLNDALEFLPEPLPRDIAVFELAASLFFRTENYAKCLEVSNNLALVKMPLSQKELYMYAESLFRIGIFAQAEPAFQAITKQNLFYEQSLYRLAEIARQKGDEQKALSFFEKIVETEKKSLWKKYAERELQFAKAAAQM